MDALGREVLIKSKKGKQKGKKWECWFNEKHACIVYGGREDKDY